MTSSELTRQLGDLPEAAQDHLERLMGSWGMLADLSFSDLVLYVPVAEEPPGRDRKSTRLNSSHPSLSRMPSSA